MKYWYFIMLVFSITITACEDVVDIETPTSKTQLIVDGLTRIDINEELVSFRIKVTTTNNFFEEIPVTAIESMVLLVEILDEDGFATTSVKTFIETESGTGIYVPDPCCVANETSTSILELDPTFRLVINYEDRRYFAETKYVPVVPIENIEKGDETLFGTDDTEIVVSFTDPPDQENFYLFDFGFNEYLLTDDRFYQGQQFEFSYFYNRIFEPGTQIEISIMGVDTNFSDYMDQLLVQSEEPQGPFQTPVSTVRGNVFDITGLDNINVIDNVERPNDFALGYFAVVQELKTSLIIE